MLIEAVILLGITAVSYLWPKFWNFSTSPSVPEFISSFPTRNDNKVKWFVDGQDYMSAVADAIEAATQEILITDWQMNPYIFMKRPDDGVDSLEWRLDKMLIRKADEGVRVYILLYWETQKVLDLGSTDTQSVLNSHQNIVVYLHPTYLTLIQDPRTILWSHHEKLVIVDRSVAFVGGIDLCYGRWDTHNHELMDNYEIYPRAKQDCGNRNKEADYKYSRWIGKDYKNTFFSSESNINWEKPYDDYDYVNRSEIPRMPWHDVACAFTGDAVSDVVKHFIQRYNAIDPASSKPPDLPTELNASEYNIPDVRSYTKAKVQVLRSVSKWSAGQPHEASIYSAYLREIENAKHYIYIENQFFISSQHDVNVKNRIQLALVERIYRAYKEDVAFHVMIVMPLKPEFGPEDWNQNFVNTDSAGVSYKNYATLFNGENSLVRRLVDKGVPCDSIKKYFSVYGLRTHYTLGKKLATEIIYVHSKLMVVDDRVTIIGSANINDRSMLGDRNSEVAVIVKDVEMINGKMNGCQYQAGQFSHTLRCFLHKEHLGLLNSQRNRMNALNVTDPLSIVSEISRQARRNTQIYERVFGSRVLPTNQVKNYDDLVKWKQEKGFVDTGKRQVKHELRRVRGNIVEFPDRFLNDELTKAQHINYAHIQKETEA